MKFTIELGRDEDLDQVRGLYVELFNEMAQLEPEKLLPARQSESFLDLIMKNDDFDIFLAKEENRVLGFIVMNHHRSRDFSCLKKLDIGYVMDLYVAREVRNRGIGEALVKKGIDWSRDKGLDCVNLDVLHSNLGARSLYEKIGFKNLNITMDLKL